MSAVKVYPGESWADVCDKCGAEQFSRSVTGLSQRLCHPCEVKRDELEARLDRVRAPMSQDERDDS